MCRTMEYLVAKPRSKRDIEQVAYNIRKTLKLEKYLYFPIVEFIENILPQIDTNFSYEYCELADMPKNTYAFYNPTDNIMHIREDVYEAACKDDGRHRFTLAHEVGHYFLHSEDVILRRSASKFEIKPFENPEWQANTFAGALLIPNNLIKNMSISQIASQCGTSYQAAEIAYKKSRAQ